MDGVAASVRERMGSQRVCLGGWGRWSGWGRSECEVVDEVAVSVIEWMGHSECEGVHGVAVSVREWMGSQ